MNFTKSWILRLACFTLPWSTALPGCVSSLQVLPIPSVLDTSKPPASGNKDYATALAAIMLVMVRDFGLPQIDGGSVFIYPSQTSFEAGVVLHLSTDTERRHKQLGPKAKPLDEAAVVSSATITAVGSNAVGMYKKVLINDWRIAKYSRLEWVRVLAHELTHTAEYELFDGRIGSPDAWLLEGFAEWIGYKVVESFGAQDFAVSRKVALDLIVTATSYQTFPALGQVARIPDWITWTRTLGRPSTYSQAFIAVDYLIQERGLRAVVEYFTLYKKLNNRERNFVTAFGESVSTFDGRFSEHLKGLLRK
jgi:hypothetical protein